MRLWWRRAVLLPVGGLSVLGFGFQCDPLLCLGDHAVLGQVHASVKRFNACRLRLIRLSLSVPIKGGGGLKGLFVGALAMTEFVRLD